MRSTIAFLFIPLLLSGCAVQGTIVEKRSRLRPDSSVIGTEGVDSFVFRGPVGTSREPTGVSNPQYWPGTGGSYKFILRDGNGNLRSQLVTPQVFARYNVGDYFNDQLSPNENNSSKESTTRRTTAAPRYPARPHERVAQRHRTHRKVARHQSRSGHTKVAHLRKNPRHAKPQKMGIIQRRTTKLQPVCIAKAGG